MLHKSVWRNYVRIYGNRPTCENIESYSVNITLEKFLELWTSFLIKPLRMHSPKHNDDELLNV